MPKKRANGMGTITKRKDGRYQAAAYVPTASGEVKRRFVYGRTPEEVTAKYVELMKQVKDGIPVPDQVWTVERYAVYWLEEIIRSNLRITTYAKYETFCRLYIVPKLGKKRLDKITPRDVRSFVNGLIKDGMSRSSARVAYMVLRSMFESARQEEVVTRNVVTLVDAPTPEERDFEPWSAEEAWKFLATARGDGLFAAFVLMITLGLRRGEVLGLRWNRVDLDKRVLWVRRQSYRALGELHTDQPVKSKKRPLPLPLLAVVALRWQRLYQAALKTKAGDRWCETGLVFTTKYGTPIEPRNLERSFKRLTDKAGLRRIRLHDLRHGCATFLADLGVHPRVAMEILGHAQSSTTMEIYTKATTEAQREAMRRMDEMFADIRRR